LHKKKKRKREGKKKRNKKKKKESKRKFGIVDNLEYLTTQGWVTETDETREKTRLHKKKKKKDERKKKTVSRQVKSK